MYASERVEPALMVEAVANVRISKFRATIAPLSRGRVEFDSMKYRIPNHGLGNFDLRGIFNLDTFRNPSSGLAGAALVAAGQDSYQRSLILTVSPRRGFAARSTHARGCRGRAARRRRSRCRARPSFQMGSGCSNGQWLRFRWKPPADRKHRAAVGNRLRNQAEQHG